MRSTSASSRAPSRAHRASFAVRSFVAGALCRQEPTRRRGRVRRGARPRVPVVHRAVADELAPAGRRPASAPVSRGRPARRAPIAPAPAPALGPRRTTAGPRSRAPRTRTRRLGLPASPGASGRASPGTASRTPPRTRRSTPPARAGRARPGWRRRSPGCLGCPPPPSRRASSRVSRLARNGARSWNSTRSAEVIRRGSARADSDSRPRGSARVSWSPGLVSSPPRWMAWMRWSATSRGGTPPAR